MTLVMVDLDNTLVDREGAVRRWANAFTAHHGGTESDARWIVAADRDGLAPREHFAAAVIERLKAPMRPDELIHQFRQHLITSEDLMPGVSESLARLRARGHQLVCVTNGTTAGQQATLTAVGLAHAFDAVLISESVGMKKPDRRIFELAAETVGASLTGAWMIGDSPQSDIVGAAAVGCKTAWINRRRGWPAELTPPTTIHDEPTSALRAILEQAG